MGHHYDVRNAHRRLVPHLLRATRSIQRGTSSCCRCDERRTVGGASCATVERRRTSHVVADARDQRRRRSVHRQLVSAPGADYHRPRTTTSVQGLWAFIDGG